VQVTYLPVHKPSKYEKANPQLFANNVRYATHALGLHTTQTLDVRGWHFLTLDGAHHGSPRAQIARALNIPTTEHGFDDVSFAMEAMKLQERPEGFGEVDLKHLR